jgi:alpha-L-rhamnosidase
MVMVVLVSSSLGRSALGAAPESAAEMTPDKLRCEYLTDPLGVDEPAPRLSWILRPDKPGVSGLRQSAYQIQVGSSAGILESGTPDLWDSGNIRSDQSIQVEYAGRPLKSRESCYWRVRAWDGSGRVTAWSRPATWKMGVLDSAEWKGRWIGATTERHIRAQQPAAAGNGYHAHESRNAADVKWVQVDLGRSVAIDRVDLVPAHPNNYQPDTPGFGFPVRFRIEASDEPTFARPTVIADNTAQDYPPPQGVAQPFIAKDVQARFVRVTATKLWHRGGDWYCFALRSLRVYSNGRDLASGAPAAASDSIDRSDWNIAQLTAAEPAVAPQDTNDAAILFRKSFATDRGKLKEATLRVSGLGYHQVFLNGQRVGDHELDPAWTNYDKRCLYVTHDVGDLVRDGDNVVGVMLGSGFYNQTTPDVWNLQSATWSAPPKLLLELQLTFEDGSSDHVVSDESWSWATGHILYQNIRGGESHDLRLIKKGWDTAAYDATGWQPVVQASAPAGAMRAQAIPPIKRTREVPVVEVAEPRPGIYVFKLAENIAGRPRLRVTGEPGQRITLRSVETLKADGTGNTDLSGFTYGRWQTDEVFLSGKGEEFFEPQFLYHGFQYVQVEGLTRRPEVGSLVGIVVHTAVEPAGTFRSSSPTLNDVHAMVVRTYLNNLHGLPTDCPQREKLGWLCDGYVASEMGMYNFRAAPLYAKWVRDMGDDQSMMKDGRISPIVPSGGWGREPQGAIMDPLWGGVTVLMPWQQYRMTGDLRLLREHYPNMKAYVDHIAAHLQPDGLLDAPRFNLLGDWLEADFTTHVSTRTPAELAANAAVYDCFSTLARTSRLLGHPDHADHYGELAARVAAAINNRFLDRASGRYAPDTQTAPAMALVLGFAPDEARRQIGQALVDNVETKWASRISTGIVGTRYLFDALTGLDRADLGLHLITQERYPGWGHILAQGGTTVWENWAGKAASLNHPALGSVGSWFYKSLGGIQLDPQVPAFKRFIIRPEVPQALDWVEASHESPYGSIRVKWQRDAKGLTLEVDVPPNTSATVYVPSSDGKVVMPGLSDPPPVAWSDGRAAVHVESGTYTFRSNP